MAVVDQMMPSGFLHCAGLWVVTDVLEEHASIFRVTELYTGTRRKKGRIRHSVRKV
jgi:hypothetical protein